MSTTERTSGARERVMEENGTHGRMGISLALIFIVLENIRPLEFHRRASLTLFMSSVCKFLRSRLLTEVLLPSHEMCIEVSDNDEMLSDNDKMLFLVIKRCFLVIILENFTILPYKII